MIGVSKDIPGVLLQDHVITLADVDPAVFEMSELALTASLFERFIVRSRADGGATPTWPRLKRQ